MKTTEDLERRLLEAELERRVLKEKNYLLQKEKAKLEMKLLKKVERK